MRNRILRSSGSKYHYSAPSAIVSGRVPIKVDKVSAGRLDLRPHWRPRSGDEVMAESPAKAKGGKSRMKRKIYEQELRKLQVELCRLQDWVKDKGLRVIIVFEGRDAAGKGGTIKAHHGAGQSARIPGRGAAGALRPGKDADVHPALHPAFSGSGRSHHLRSQLVQSGGRRVRDGILHRAAAPDFSQALSGNRKLYR